MKTINTSLLVNIRPDVIPAGGRALPGYTQSNENTEPDIISCAGATDRLDWTGGIFGDDQFSVNDVAMTLQDIQGSADFILVQDTENGYGGYLRNLTGSFQRIRVVAGQEGLMIPTGFYNNPAVHGNASTLVFCLAPFAGDLPACMSNSDEFRFVGNLQYWGLMVDGVVYKTASVQDGPDTLINQHPYLTNILETVDYHDPQTEQSWRVIQSRDVVPHHIRLLKNSGATALSLMNAGSINNSVEELSNGDIAFCLKEKSEVLQGLLSSIVIEAMYLNSIGDLSYLPGSYQHIGADNIGSHQCNNANAELYANGIFIGNILMNNGGGSAGGTLTSSTDPVYVYQDYYNTPAALTGGVWNGDPLSRYARLTISAAQAEQLVAASASTVLDFNLTLKSSSPHSGITWLRISRIEENDSVTIIVDKYADNNEHFSVNVRL